ncbi:hypothetical protein KAR91_72795 [Candidatus Pacearchaeota archaeon]|nr:hypothetical protein [Candidatus Pacearchaeota archaeon]
MRDYGFYWVQCDGVWEPALFDHEGWSFIGSEELECDSEIEEVGDKIEAPE